MKKKIVIYWAAPLFTQAERIWNRLCAEYLSERGFEVLLPQDRARNFGKDGGGMDFDGLARDCLTCACTSDVMVAILDGSDTDSGVGVEYGGRVATQMIAGAKKFTIGVRTDFRKAEDGNLNAMFRPLDCLIYFPSTAEDWQALCQRILVLIENEYRKD